jgi:hypothetical protein
MISPHGAQLNARTSLTSSGTEVMTMWIVQRSDISHRSPWASSRDAKHYIGCLGHVVPINAHTFDVHLLSGEHVTATMVRG